MRAATCSRRNGKHCWALSCYDDIVTVTRDAKAFCSGRGITVRDWPPDLAEAFSHMLAQDAPARVRVTREPNRGMRHPP